MADKALLVGINEYESIGDLQGCLEDLKNMKSLLMNSFEFLIENIHVLKDEDVLYDRIVDEFAWLYRDVEPGDRLVFHFSGHGSFTENANDEDDEKIDELLCLYNMDWDDPDSYMVDTDLGKRLEGLPEGAEMTVILDACHSGTGTKAISPRSGKSIKNVTSKSRMMIVEDTKATLSRRAAKDFESKMKSGGEILDSKARSQARYARFVKPPARIEKLYDATKLKRVGDSVRSSEKLNHQLLAAATADQTAADAFIDSKYQGAFTHHLCKASRTMGEGTSVSDLMSSVKSMLRDGFYSQIPQLEGIRQNERLFGGEATGSDEAFDKKDSFDSAIAEESFGPIASGMSGGFGEEAFMRLCEVQSKFLDLGLEVMLSGRSAAAPIPPRVQTAAIQGSRGIEHIVYVHGISQHRPGYSNEWFAAMRPHLNRLIPKSEVVWSDLVNPRSVIRSTKSAEMSKFEAEIRKEIENRKKTDEMLADGANPQVTQRGLFDSGFKLDDFGRYMFFEETRDQIIQRFHNIVIPLLEAGKRVHIVSHSWGTVVSYEALRLLDGRTFPGKVGNLFTAGSALSIGAVQSNLFGRVTDGRKPKHVERIYNVHAGGDAIGGSIKDEFTINAEFLSLNPIGCSTIPFTGIAWSLTCAHGSYFKSDNIVVNRNIFARLISG